MQGTGDEDDGEGRKRIVVTMAHACSDGRQVVPLIFCQPPEAPSVTWPALEAAGHVPVTRFLRGSPFVSAKWRVVSAE